MMANSASERTKRNLAAALKEKMSKKSLEQITIQELTDACGMQRRAFYYHFEDIYALVKWMFQEEAISLLQQQEGALLWQEGLLQLFHYLEENKSVCLCALRSSGHDALKRFFSADLEGILSKELKKTARQLDLDLDPEGIPLFVSALGGITEAWLLGLFPDTPEKMVSKINGFLQSHIYGMQVLQHHPEWIGSAGNASAGEMILPAQPGNGQGAKK